MGREPVTTPTIRSDNGTMSPALRTRHEMRDRPDDRTDRDDRSGRDVSRPPTELLRLAPESANVAVARRFVAGWFARTAGIDPAGDLCADLMLVTSELVTNAVEYGDSHLVDVSVSVDGAMCILSVTSHSARHLAPSEDWQMSGAGSATGRGLGIVRALVDSIDVRADGDRVTVIVSRRAR
jgi:anti-sigma regulatory factor (Ser/Thr protein kinase)